MGRGPGDAEATRRLTPYAFAPAAAGDPVVRFVGRRRHARGHADRGLERDPEGAARARRARAGRRARRRGHHRAGLLRRWPAPGHARRRRLAGLEVLRLHQRADGGRAGLRPGQAGRGHLRGVRSGRRHLRHLDPQARRRRVRGQVDRRRLGAGRRRFRSRDRRRICCATLGLPDDAGGDRAARAARAGRGARVERGADRPRDRRGDAATSADGTRRSAT